MRLKDSGISAVALSLILGVAPFTFVAAQQGTGPRIPAVDTVVRDELVKQNIVGGAVAVVRNGMVVHTAGYGHKSLKRNTRVSDATIFRWASISKPLTAVAALQLDEANNGFEIEDTAASHVSYWPSSGSKGDITVEQLLSNRAGIIHYSESEDCPDNSDPSFNRSAHGNGWFNAEDAVDVFKDQALCFPPGTDYRYSTFGFTVAAAAIEEASGQSYNSLVMNNIAAPLGMTSLRQATGTSNGYELSCGELMDVSEPSKSYVLPGGGWESNIVDLARFANGILQGTLLANTDRLWTENTGNTNRYRLGINVSSGNARVWHGGAHDDTRTFMHLYPGRADGLGVVVYLNGSNGDAERVAKRVAMALGVTTWNESGKAVVPTCDDDCGGSFSSVWRKTNKDVILRLGMSTQDFGTEWRYLREHGYYLDDFETKKSGSYRVLWDGTFRKGRGGNAMWRNFRTNDFNAKWKEQSARGYRLVDVETYKIGSTRYWAGLFRPGTGRYAMLRYYNTSEFAIKRREFAAKGLKLIDIEPFMDGGNLKWAGVWIAGQDGLLNRNYSTNDFGVLRRQRERAGYKLIDLERYVLNNTVKWAGIWERSSQSERLNRNYRMCGSTNSDGELTSRGILDRHEQWRDGGYELIDWERD